MCEFVEVAMLKMLILIATYIVTYVLFTATHAPPRNILFFVQYR